MVAQVARTNRFPEPLEFLNETAFPLLSGRRLSISLDAYMGRDFFNVFASGVAARSSLLSESASGSFGAFHIKGGRQEAGEGESVLTPWLCTFASGPTPISPLT